MYIRKLITIPLCIAAIVLVVMVLVNGYGNTHSAVATVLALKQSPYLVMASNSNSDGSNNDNYVFVSWVNTRQKIDLHHLKDIAQKNGWEVVEVGKDYITIIQYIHNLNGLLPDEYWAPKVSITCKVYANGTILCYAMFSKSNIALIMYMNANAGVVRPVTAQAVINVLRALGPGFDRFSSEILNGVSGRSDIKYLVMLWSDYGFDSPPYTGTYELSPKLKPIVAGYIAAISATDNGVPLIVYIDGTRICSTETKWSIGWYSYGYTYGNLGIEFMKPGILHKVSFKAPYGGQGFVAIVALLGG